MSSLDPQKPVRADFRFIKKMMNSILSGKVVHRSDEFGHISDKFSEEGGSWVGIFKGSPKDVELLKKVIKSFFDEGLLTKTQKWD